MKMTRITKIVVRFTLFVWILALGTMITLVIDESKGLALADLSISSESSIFFVAQGEVLYVGATDSEGINLYQSLNNGHTWYGFNFIPNSSIQILITRPDDESIVYAGGASETDNLWRSEDGGRHWKTSPLKLPAETDGTLPTVTAMTIDPNHPDHLYVGMDNQSVYRLIEGEMGYELIGDFSLPQTEIKQLNISSEGQLFALTPVGLYRTEGKVWERVDSLPDYETALIVAEENILYAGTASTGLYRSLDGGQNWEAINQGLGLSPGVALRITDLAVDDQNPAHLVTTTAYQLGQHLAPGGVYESFNGGDTWSKVSDLASLATGLTVHEGIIHAVTEKGLQQFGQPQKPAAVEVESSLLTVWGGTEGLIWLFTLGLGGLILLVPINWIVPR